MRYWKAGKGSVAGSLCGSDLGDSGGILFFYLEKATLDYCFFKVKERLLKLMAFSSGNLLNVEDISRSLGIGTITVKKYIDILEGSFLLRRLEPFHANLTKRLVKSPKLYLRDTGLMHRLRCRSLTGYYPKILVKDLIALSNGFLACNKWTIGRVCVSSQKRCIQLKN